MAEHGGSGKVPLTLHLPAEVAARLKLAAEAQKQAAAELAVELLDRHLPRLPPGGQKKVHIPYA